MRTLFKAIWKALFGKGGYIETMRDTTTEEYYRKNWDFCGAVGVCAGEDDDWGFVMGRITGTPYCVWD